ncbi:universal stress protein [Aequorivita echinoideorum]|uniref:Universal stress protein n=1 Tax=Aequorivita echinoideorum TaxID=1549647 RepID=A0ABS5S427_9FLAO|nr:universal stress protein [Aequorivita echinoideorum]MBT0607969.1 universal stress protein [Aequorivita echinoideorum]
MKKVVIAIDYNPTSEKVVRMGREIAQLMNAEICLLHVLADVRYYGMQYEPFMGYEGYAFPVDFHIQEDMIKVAEDYLAKTAKHLDNQNVSTHLAEGDTAKSIIKFSEEWNADLIVMGTHSHGTLEKLLLGTVPSGVLERTKIPVYLIPTGEK